MPVDSSDEDLASRLAGVSKTKSIVVYCQSNQCPYAGAIARRLQKTGYTAPALDEQQVAKALSYLHPVWDSLFPREQERIMRLLLDKVILQENEIDIRLRTDGLELVAAELATE